MRRQLIAILFVLILLLSACNSLVKSKDISDNATDEEKDLIIELIEDYDENYEDFDVEKAMEITDDYLNEREKTSNVFAYLNTDENLEGSESEIEMYHEFLLELSVIQFKTED